MSVNYIVEINALNAWELCHPLSATAYKVLLKLYHLANNERFPERIPVPNRVLMSMVGCSEDSLIKARNQLIQYGRIAYKGQKKLTPVYMIQYFSLKNTAYNSEFQSIEQGYEHGIEQGYEHGIEHGIKHGTYINKTIQGEIKENQSDIYTEEDINAIAQEIASRNGHEGNTAYIEGIKRNLRNGGNEAVRNAKAELERHFGSDHFGYQTHSYRASDFDESFYYDPERDFLGVAK